MERYRGNIDRKNNNIWSEKNILFDGSQPININTFVFQIVIHSGAFWWLWNIFLNCTKNTMDHVCNILFGSLNEHEK